ncbi:hypothetical protein OS493_029245 [Desmophyllum pertusum]|uniref:Uncharacterized protein n=1 Tax=Desmophyllum pertusum TaxID=174260 RepID=A0A9X0D1D6_9CNID|nr:hypothetical protein OS493_029245 [Desmophyllum pertusum]
MNDQADLDVILSGSINCYNCLQQSIPFTQIEDDDFTNIFTPNTRQQILEKDDILKNIIFDPFLQNSDLSELDFNQFQGVSHHELLQELESVELGITIGSILEDYIKFTSVDDFRLRYMKLADSYTTIVEFLFTTKEANQELICQVLEQLRQVSDASKRLKILDSALETFEFSTIVVYSYIYVGDYWCSLYASFGQVDLAASGYYVCAFSDTRTSELLTRWILKNGGLKAFDEFIRNKQEVASNGSALSSIGESIKENIKLLGNRIDIQSE